ncbi:tetratricopeptide repeat protein [Halobacteriovorax sp.]|uniref:tetratricopeptide repeat protein n=1 Tax=Halobacteriovorax sp. TaxID=2020862 RepID=UPI003564C18B
MLFKKLFKTILFCALLTSSFSSFSNDNSRRNELVKVIDLELKEVTRLNKQTRTSNPDLLLRMAELLLEKARLVKELENSRYVKLPAEQRQKIDRNKFFSSSNNYFIQAQKTCQLILKKFPKFSGKSDVYYIMAYNAKEFQQDKKAQTYFSRSVKSSKKTSFTSTRSKIALAEIYFNQGQYKKAIPLYENAFRNKRFRDKWYTKDSVNLAWSYYRSGREKRAISLMREAYKLSKNSKYIDMSFSIERDLAYFYTDSGRVDQAVKFYKSIGKNIASNLLKVSTYLMSRGKYSPAEKTLKQALSYKVSEEEDIEINIKLLNLYERFGKYHKHLSVAKLLLRYYEQKKLNGEQIKVLEYQLKRISGIIQKQVNGKQYKKQKKTLQSKAKLAVGYFSLLAQYDPLNAYKYSFLAAETYFAADMNNSAVEAYSESLKRAQDINNSKYIKLSNEGMMAALGGKNISKKNKDKYIEVAYLNSLRADSKSKQANKIYQRLFGLYFDRGDIPSCEKTLISYKNSFPRNFSTQEAMLARIMEHHKKKGNLNGIKSWVLKINAGEFKVTPKFAKKVKLAMLTMQFENVEKASSKGDKKQALALYVHIYKDPTSDAGAKQNASYNIATLFHELGDSYRSYGWTKRALSHMSSRNVKKFQGSFLVIANGLFDHQKSSESVEIYSLVLDKLCKQRSSNKAVFLKNAVVVALADDQGDRAREVLDSAYRCNISTSKIDELELDILEYEIEKKNWSSALKQIEKLSSSKKIYAKLIHPLGRIRNAYLAAGRVSNARNIERDILRYYSKVRNKKSFELEALDEVAMIKIDNVERRVKQFKNIELAFPDKKFNGLLQKKFLALDGLTAEAVKTMDIGSGKGIVKSYKILIDAYSHLINEIDNFTPPGKSKEYIDTFKKSMRNLIRPLKAKTADFKKEAVAQIKKSKILSSDNSAILFGQGFVPEYVLRNNGVIMDRGGQR